MTIQTLSLSVSSPVCAGGKPTIDSMLRSGLSLPIELENDCTEEGITIDSDNISLTNAIRRHFLVHFGHRDLDGIVSDYADNAILIQVTNGIERTKYHGHEEIRRYFSEVVFPTHPTGNSSFQLQHISVQQKHAMIVWSAKTPGLVLSQGSDAMVFNAGGKIIKQFFACHSHTREDSGISRIVRKDENEYGEFFE